MKKLLYLALILLGIGIMSSCKGGQKNSNLQGYEWLEGRWEYTEDEMLTNKAIITPSYIQSYFVMTDEGEDASTQPKLDYEIKVCNYEFTSSDLKAICIKSSDGEGGPIYYIDEAAKDIYFFYDFDIEIHLSKVE